MRVYDKNSILYQYAAKLDSCVLVIYITDFNTLAACLGIFLTT